MPFLFSYGTLRDPAVQKATFGRTLPGREDRILGYRIDMLAIADAEVVALSGETHHPILVATGSLDDTVDGSVFDLTDDDLRRADDYEVDDYHRVEVPLASGGTAWAYVSQ